MFTISPVGQREMCYVVGLTFVSRVKDSGKAQRSVLAHEATLVRLVHLDVGVPSPFEPLAELGCDVQADLLAAVPCEVVTTRSVSEPRQGGSSRSSLTVALIIRITIHQRDLDPLVEELTEDLEVLSDDEVSGLSKR